MGKVCTFQQEDHNEIAGFEFHNARFNTSQNKMLATNVNIFKSRQIIVKLEFSFRIILLSNLFWKKSLKFQIQICNFQ